MTTLLRFSLSVDPIDHRQIERLARESKRTVAAEIRVAIANHLAAAAAAKKAAQQ